ncbi:MAG: winged helix-turn-helix transcriptional regulator [Bacteroidaceae bacterium]|nr:winged helix-turn-helix transcriptional regulator [Bacteroidaceae bacterium]
MKIVIIENEDMASSLRNALRGRTAGADGLCVSDALAREIAAQQPDVLLMDTRVMLGSFTFMPDCMRLERGSRHISLSVYQTKLLYLLCACMNVTVRREEIHRMLWPDVIVIDQSVNNLIYQLRKILSADTTIRIDNIRGVGYRLSVR